MCFPRETIRRTNHKGTPLMMGVTILIAKGVEGEIIDNVKSKSNFGSKLNTKVYHYQLCHMCITCDVFGCITHVIHTHVIDTHILHMNYMCRSTCVIQVYILHIYYMRRTCALHMYLLHMYYTCISTVLHLNIAHMYYRCSTTGHV